MKKSEMMSKVMKEAWNLKKNYNITSFSTALKLAWRIVRASTAAEITFNFVGSEQFTVNMETGVVTGKTYNSRNTIKKDFSGKWDGKNWTVDVSEIKEALEKWGYYYMRNIVDSKNSKTAEKPSEEKKEVKSWLENNEKAEGFIWVTRWSDNTITSKFVG